MTAHQYHQLSHQVAQLNSDLKLSVAAIILLMGIFTIVLIGRR